MKQFGFFICAVAVASALGIGMLVISAVVIGVLQW